MAIMDVLDMMLASAGEAGYDRNVRAKALRGPPRKGGSGWTDGRCHNEREVATMSGKWPQLTIRHVPVIAGITGYVVTCFCSKVCKNGRNVRKRELRLASNSTLASAGEAGTGRLQALRGHVRTNCVRYADGVAADSTLESAGETGVPDAALASAGGQLVYFPRAGENTTLITAVL